MWAHVSSLFAVWPSTSEVGYVTWYVSWSLGTLATGLKFIDCLRCVRFFPSSIHMATYDITLCFQEWTASEQIWTYTVYRMCSPCCSFHIWMCLCWHIAFTVQTDIPFHLHWIIPCFDSWGKVFIQILSILEEKSVSPPILHPQKSQGYTPFESILESSLHRTSSCGRILGPFDDHRRLGWFDRNPTTWDGCTAGSSRRWQNSGCCTGKTTFNHWKHGKIWSTEATRFGWIVDDVDVRCFCKVCFLCFFGWW